MQNQKNPNHLHHQFIRKPKRKPSPKQKDQNAFNFKCPHTKNTHTKSKEEYTMNDYSQKQSKLQQNIVLDLKNQLSFLKDQMAKIVNTKTNQNIEHKKISKQHNQYLQTKTQQNQKSVSRQAKKLKSKQRLKFSKIKKSQKYLPISPKKSLQSLETAQTNNNRQKQKDIGQLSNIQQSSIAKNHKKSFDQSTLQDQIKKINLKHKKQLDNKLTQLFQQQNIDKNNIPPLPNQNKKNQQNNNNEQKSKQQKTKLTNANIVHYQIRISKQKKQIKQLEVQINTLKKTIVQKDELILKIQNQLANSKQQVDLLKHQAHIKQIQITSLTKKVSEIIYNKNQLQSKYDLVNAELKKQKSINNQIKQQKQLVQHKLKIRQMEIVKLEKVIKNCQNQKNNIVSQKEEHIKQCQGIMERLKQDIVGNQKSHGEEICKLQKVIEQTRNMLKEKDKLINKSKQSQPLSINPNISSNQVPQSLLLTLPSQPSITSPNPSPKNSSSSSSQPVHQNFAVRQKQLLSIIKMNQKSIQNYQKDLSFLQQQCKNLHFYKQLCKKQQTIIQQNNQFSIKQQIQKLNSKYSGLITKRKSFQSSGKVDNNGNNKK